MTRASQREDCCAYIRNYYGVPAYVGVRVRVRGREGVIVQAKHSQHYVHIRFDGDRKSDIYHPTDGVEYLGVAVARVKCDGNHGAPRCADPECWNP